MAMDKKVKAALKKHMMKGKGAHPDPAAKGMKKGGPTGEDRARDGRNVSRAKNQGA